MHGAINRKFDSANSMCIVNGWPSVGLQIYLDVLFYGPTTEGAVYVLVCVICMQTGYLRLIGGLNVKAATIAVMKLVTTTQLARLISFCGKRGKQ